MNLSHPLAKQQIEAVEKVLSELDVASIPKLMVWNKVKRDIFSVGLQSSIVKQPTGFLFFIFDYVNLHSYWVFSVDLSFVLFFCQTPNDGMFSFP